MSNNPENAFLRLGYALRELKDYHNTTIILGAGCSLSSTSNDISTVGIMKSCLLEHNISIKEIESYTWEELYKKFIDIVWEGKAQKERQFLLKKKLDNTEPSEGHKYLRTLIEKGYIHNVITTNFDMLLEKALNGLSYRKRVGNNDYKIIGQKPMFNLMKIHGDLEDGEFRFAPHELMKLPENLCKDIVAKTSGLLLFLGYRGQDIGLMNAISSLHDFAVYWIDINGPHINDVYESRHIYELMAQRDSINNFLCGKEFGDFQKITEKLYNFLIESKYSNIVKSKEMVINKQWNETSIVELLKIYDRIYEFFLDILNKSEAIGKKLHKSESSKNYSECYKQCLYSYLYFFKSKQLPSYLLHIPRNEVDALIIGVSIEIIVRSQIYDVNCDVYLSELKTEIDKRAIPENYDKSFWNAISRIVCTNKQNPKLIKLNINQNLILENYDIPLDNFNELISVVQFLALLLPNSIKAETNFDENYRIHKLLIEKCRETSIIDDKMYITIEQFNPKDINSLYQRYIKLLPDVTTQINSEQYIVYDSKWVNLKITLQQECHADDTSSSVYLLCKRKSKKNMDEFLLMGNAFHMSINNYITLKLDIDLQKFLLSDYSSIFVSGSSGSGKTSSIRQLLVHSQHDENIVPIIVSPKIMSMEKVGLSLFLDTEINDNEEELLLQNIDSSFSLRGGQLLLIFDGLNEINDGLKLQQAHYCALLALAHKIFINKCKNIKLVITCRRNAYFNYMNSTSLHLNPMYFYSNNDYSQNIEGLDDASYNLIPLDVREKENLLNSYKILNPKVREAIINNTVPPYFISIASEIIGEITNVESETKIAENLNAIYDLFSKTMIARIEKNKTNIAQKIIYAYFDYLINSTDIEVTKFGILEYLPKYYYQDFEDTLNALIDVNIFLQSSDNRIIRFCHDKVEENFFKEYINEYESKGISFFIGVFNLSDRSFIYHNGLLFYFNEMLRNKKIDLYKKCFINTFDEYVRDCLPKMMLESLSTVTNLEECILLLLNNNDKYFKKVFNLILLGIDSFLKDYSLNDPDISKIIDILLKSSKKLRFINNDLAYLYFFKSKLDYYKNDYINARKYADMALKSVSKVNYELLSSINVQYAIIYMELGFSKKSILLLKEELENNPSKLIDIGIELGRALDHSGQVKQALELYKKFDDCNITDTYLLSRFYEQKANVLNKIMYRILQYGFISASSLQSNELEQVEELFSEAIDLYNRSIELTLKINALWSYTGIVPQLINTYISFSFSLREIGIDECTQYIDEVDKMLENFVTPFKTDFYLSKAYYYEYLKNITEAKSCINIALDNAKELEIKTKEAKCYGFFSQFIYRQLLQKEKSTNRKELATLGMEYTKKALCYYKEYTLVEDNIFIEDYTLLKEKFMKILKD